VRALERDGWSVATTDQGGEVTVAADLSDPAAPPLVFDAAEAAVGPVTALVACHAHSELGGLLEVTSGDFDRHVAANARGTLLLMAELARRFAGEPGSGRIVAYTSGLPLRGEIAYAASKGAIEWIAVSAAAELAPRGITVNAIEPGPTDTGWMGAELRERIRGQTPLGRLGRPEDSAELAAFVCSRRADWITGQILHCDGGWSALRTPRHGREPL
jgi:3-oxoacyl-[acyl-carrier protein] reductase